MIQRPISVSAVCLILIVLGVISIATTGTMLAERGDPEIAKALADNPLSLPFFVAVGLVCPVVMIVAAIGIFRGHNWARWLATADIVASLVLRAIAAPKLLLFPADVILIYFLFTPTANAFFARRDSGT